MISDFAGGSLAVCLLWACVLEEDSFVCTLGWTGAFFSGLGVLTLDELTLDELTLDEMDTEEELMAMALELTLFEATELELGALGAE